LEYKTLPGTLQSSTIAITVQPNIKGLVGFGGVSGLLVVGVVIGGGVFLCMTGSVFEAG
jgi:hypothetical protein